MIPTTTVANIQIALASQSADPYELILVTENYARGHRLFEHLLKGLRVRQRWMMNGSRRAELDSGNVLRLVSAGSRAGLRGRSARAVVFTRAALDLSDSLLADASAAIATDRHGWVAVL